MWWMRMTPSQLFMAFFDRKVNLISYTKSRFQIFIILIIKLAMKTSRRNHATLYLPAYQ